MRWGEGRHIENIVDFSATDKSLNYEESKLIVCLIVW